jgi:hypothetical protein
MQSYEYIAVPAPRKGVSSKGVKGVAGKFSNAVTLLMNEMAADGWDYIRSDTLPCEERQGLTGKTVKYHAMMMFRRAVEVEDQDEPLALPSPEEEIEVEDPVDTQDESTDEMSEQDDETETETKSD